MSDAGIFVPVDRRGLIAEIQRRIDSGGYVLIPAYNKASMELAGAVQARWFNTAPARDDFYTAIFGNAVNGRSLPLVTAARRYIPACWLRQHAGTWGCVVLGERRYPAPVMLWLKDTFDFPHHRRGTHGRN